MEKSEPETGFHNEKAENDPKNPPVYDMPPDSNAIGVVPVSTQPVATYVQVQPVVSSVPVVSTAPVYTSMCECDRVWCSLFWLK